MPHEKRVLSRDASRPYFVRKPGEIGVYLDVLDAKPKDPNKYGLKHFFIQDLQAKLFSIVESWNLSNIKGLFEKHQLLDGIVIRGFQQGIIMVLCVESAKSAQALYEAYQNGSLLTVVQVLFDNNSDVLEAADLDQLHMKIRMWEDEILKVRDEFDDCRSVSPLSANRELYFAQAHQILKELKEYQASEIADHIMNLRDKEQDFNVGLGEFVQAIKHNAAPSLGKIRFMSEYKEIERTFLAKKPHKDTLQSFRESIDALRHCLDEFESKVNWPLMQIRCDCFNEEQLNSRQIIREHCQTLVHLLRNNGDFGALKHDEWKLKVLNKEQPLLLALVSLIPCCLERIIDIDLKLDRIMQVEASKS